MSDVQVNEWPLLLLNMMTFEEVDGKIREKLVLAQEFCRKGMDIEVYQSISVAALYCYACRHPDSGLVADILAKIFNARPYCFPYLDILVERCSYLGANSVDIGCERVLEYFINHSRMVKQEFGAGRRYVDLYLFHRLDSAIEKGDLSFVQLLFRYGAKPEILFKRILQSLVKELWKFYCREDREMFEKKADFVRLSMRVIRRIPTGILDFTICYDSKKKSIKAKDFVSKMIQEGKLSFMLERCIQPPQLKHLCRIEIRNALNRPECLEFASRHSRVASSCASKELPGLGVRLVVQVLDIMF